MTKAGTAVVFCVLGTVAGAGLYIGNVGYIKATSATPDGSPPSPIPPISLQTALLSSGTVGSTAIVQSYGSDLSQIGAICDGHVSGDTATAYETITDEQTGTILDETLVSWDSAADAGQGITAARQELDQNRSCSVTSNAVTIVYTGDNPGSPPSSCVSPGQYFSTQVRIYSSSSSSFVFPFSGFAEVVRCGTTTIFVRIYSNLPDVITKQTADGYLSTAVDNLK